MISIMDIRFIDMKYLLDLLEGNVLGIYVGNRVGIWRRGRNRGIRVSERGEDGEG